ncbi:MAG: hypothetical protein ABI199_02705 [Bacteroidia bacterium]
MIYDCFTFFNEFDLLEIRLNELNNVVDKFVLVEATKTHQGNDKPLYFDENKERYKAFSKKIIHIIVNDYPSGENLSPWAYEHNQRNMIRRGLEKCAPDDVIIISDVDEIPNPDKIKEHHANHGIKIFRQRMFCYFINCMNETITNSPYTWNGSIMVNYKDIGNPQDLRELGMHLLRLYHPNFYNRTFWNVFYWGKMRLKKQQVFFIKEGGWHFSYLGGVEKIIKKLEAFAHSEYNKVEYKDIKKIESAINNGNDIFGRGFNYKIIKIDDSFPKYIVENIDKYKQYIK